MKLTQGEQEAVTALNRVAKDWPKSLWLFSANGTLCVVKKKSDGKRAMMTGNSPGFDQDYVVAHVNIENDGGDW